MAATVSWPGLVRAADDIAAQFAEAGLKTDHFDKRAFQKFAITTSAKLGPGNKLALVGPPPKEGQKARRIELKPGTDFNPMSLSGSGTLNLPLVFVGYGITGKREGYDDFAGADVKGKAVVILQFGDSKIGGLEDIDSALRKHKAGDRVQATVRRGKEELTFEITLDPPR